MVIELKSDIFNSSDFKAVNFLIQICTYKNRYDIFVDLTTIQPLSLFKRLDLDDQNLLIANFDVLMNNQTTTLSQSASITNTNYYVTLHPQNHNEYNMAEAIRFFMQPLSILLENSKNDACFIEAIIEHFDNTTKIKEHIQNGWIQFENAGGCDNIINFLDAKMQSFNNMPKADKATYIRCFVLIDSDKKYANDPLSASKRKTKRFLDDNHIPSQILIKRNMENYVPTEIFNDIQDKTLQIQNWINAYKALDTPQKDFLDISKGFSKKNNDGTSKKDRNTINQETNNLYQNLDSQSFDSLNKGFDIGDFKEIFPTYFKYRAVTEETLKARANSDELESIIRKINDLL
jgi:hypothetical protein